MFTIQHVAPFLDELLTINDLKLLHSLCRISSRRNAFIVHKLRQRLINHLIAYRAHTKAKVDIFIVSGHKPAIESAKTVEDFLFDQQRGSGTIINFASE